MTESDTLNARVCRKCSADPSKVYDIRISADDIVTRRRECLECGYRWVTVEINRDIYEKLKRDGDNDPTK